MPGKEQSSGELINQVVSLFRSVMKVLGPQNMEEMLKLDLTMPQLKVLTVLLYNGPTSVGGLASALGVALPTMTGILDRLVERGLVQRYESPGDRRLVINRITDPGATLLVNLRQSSMEKVTSVLQRLAPEDLSQLASALDKLRLAAEQEAQQRNESS